MAALDDFKKFLVDAQSGAQYLSWLRDNSGLTAQQKKQVPLPPPTPISEAGKWFAFRDSVLAGGTNPAPIMATDHGKELVDVAVETQDFVRLETPIPPPTPPPPPPSGNRVGNGFICNLQGNSYAQMSDTEKAHYGGIIVGFGDYANVANFAKAHPTVHGFGYQTSIESGGASQFWYGAVDDATARKNGWVLKTLGGIEITNGYGYLMLDISNPAYQKAWCDYVRSRVSSTGLTGKFLDNVTGTMMIGSWFHEGAPAGWTDTTLKSAYISMLKAQQAQLPGVYRLANAYDTDRLGWWKTIAPYVDGIMFEYYDGSDYANSCIAAAQSAGKDAWVLVDPSRGQPGPDSAAGIALAAKFATVWDGKGGGFGFNGVGVWREGAGTWTDAIS